MDMHQQGWEGFIELCLLTKNKKTTSTLLNLFLTPEEKADLSKRFLIIKELLIGKKTQREIAKDLNVSIAKITRGSNELKRTNNKLLTYLKQKLTE